jgi:hypothetical protein
MTCGCAASTTHRCSDHDETPCGETYKDRRGRSGECEDPCGEDSCACGEGTPRPATLPTTVPVDGFGHTAAGSTCSVRSRTSETVMIARMPSAVPIRRPRSRRSMTSTCALWGDPSRVAPRRRRPTQSPSSRRRHRDAWTPWRPQARSARSRCRTGSALWSAAVSLRPLGMFGRFDREAGFSRLSVSQVEEMRAAAFREYHDEFPAGAEDIPPTPTTAGDPPSRPQPPCRSAIPARSGFGDAGRMREERAEPGGRARPWRRVDVMRATAGHTAGAERSSASRSASPGTTSSSTSTTLSRLVAPDTRLTCRRRTPRAPASPARAASVAAPSTARALTATTSRSPCSPPTRGRDAPGLTLIAMRTYGGSAGSAANRLRGVRAPGRPRAPR